ncbi:MAG: hypothetical protein ACRCTE_09055 [Cellulosilyticaceae bacterium]
MIVLVIIFILTIATCFFIGKRAANDPIGYIRQHKSLTQSILMGYLVFAGCFMFPISSKPYPLDFSKLYMLILSYGIIGLGFAKLHDKSKIKWLYTATLALTLVGMVSRYLLEYGEVSNTYNFTSSNMLLYIILIPIYTTLIYAFTNLYSPKNHS